MGLFDIFKKKPPTHEKKVDLAYRCYKKELVGTVFPGGKNQASNIIISLAKLFNVDLNACSAQQYYSVLSCFTDVFIRCTIMNMADERIVASLQVKHRDYIKTKTVAEKVLAFCKLSMSDPAFILNNPKDLVLLDGCSGSMTENEHKAVQNIAIQEESIDDPEYGLCMTKPVYTSGSDDAEMFLNSLTSALGEDLSWEQRETLDVDGIAGKVIVFDSYLPSGKSYKTLYVNEHGINAERRVPKGFLTKKSNPISTSADIEENYYFENPLEFAMYAKLYNKRSIVNWVSSDKYLEMYKKGYQLFECGQYAKAIDTYKECLKLNPIGISARFELVECYIVMKQLQYARKNLYEMKEYLFDNAQKARFYRRLGYIAVEEGSFKEAYACYQYSLNFENHPSVIQEIQYIESKAGASVKGISVEDVLNTNNVPVI